MRRAIYTLLFLSLSAYTQGQKVSLVYDICGAGAVDSYPTFLTAFQNKLYFTATDGIYGIELWEYDGKSNPKLSYDLCPGSGNGAAAHSGMHMVGYKGRLYFSGHDGSSGQEVFSYDGASRPSLLADIMVGSGAADPRDFLADDSNLYFTAKSSAAQFRQLFRYDGFTYPVRLKIDTSGTSYIPASGTLTALNGKCYFSALTSTTGTELFVYDPALDSVKLVEDFYPGSIGSAPIALTAIGNKLFFFAKAPGYGFELCSYDGNKITRNTDLAPGNADGVHNYTKSICELNGSIYFSGSTNGISYQLYRFDTLTDSSSLVAVINTSSSAQPCFLTRWDSSIYFTATNDAQGTELWRTNGITTEMVADIAQGKANGFPSDLYVWNGDLYMNARTPDVGHELFRLSKTLGVQAMNVAGSVHVYPNPANTIIGLDIDMEQPMDVSLTVCDAMGRSVADRNVHCANGRTHLTVPTDALNEGQYFYRLYDTNKKLLKQGRVEVCH